jgi:hypothetical protein
LEDIVERPEGTYTRSFHGVSRGVCSARFIYHNEDRFPGLPLPYHRRIRSNEVTFHVQ